MTSLVDRYQPRRIADFVGLDKPKAILSRMAASPYAGAWLLLGPSGTGKTSMALALAEEIQAELHHVPSRKCDLEMVDRVVEKCWYVPLYGGFHLVLVDEADQMSKAAQLAFLSKLDSTAQPPQTIFIFTANDTANLEDRFLSRCRTLAFDAPTPQAITDLLARVWRAENSAPAPDLAAIAQGSRGNVRQALMDMELDLLVLESPLFAGTPIPVPTNGTRKIGQAVIAACLRL